MRYRSPIPTGPYARILLVLVALAVRPSISESMGLSCMPPPTNDECANASAVPVSPGVTCTATASGTVAGATFSGGGGAGTCSFFGPDDDVWFSFTATSNDHTISLLNIAGSATALGMRGYAGNCPTSQAQDFCVDGNSYQSFNFVPGTLYYVQVFTQTTTPGQDTSFDVCVTTVPIVPPPTNDDCPDALSVPVNPGATCIATTSGTVAGATFSGGGGAGTCSFFGPDDDVWFSFTATSNDHTISLLNIAGSATALGMRGYASNCPTSQAQEFCVDGNSYQSFSFAPGTLYYVQVFTQTTTPGQDTSFDVCVTTVPIVPPPANDDCVNALSVPVNPGATCIATTSGTVAGATFSGGGGAGTCSFFGPDDDVWFSFTATSNDHTISLLNIAGSATALGMRGYASNCPTSQAQEFCVDGNSYQSSSFAPGTLYYVQVFTLTTTPGLDTSFDVCVTTDITTGVPGHDLGPLRLYPQPASDVLHLTGQVPGTLLTLMDATGRRVLESVTSPLNLSALAAGTYVLQLNTPDHVPLGRLPVVKE